MERLKNTTLGTRLAIESATLAAVVAISLLILADQLSNRHRALHESYSIIAAQLAQSATEYVVDGDRLGLQAQLQELLSNPAIAYAAIEDPDRQVLVEHGAAIDTPLFDSPIRVDDSVAGYANIQLVQDPTRELTPPAMLLFGGLMFLTIALFVKWRLRRLDSTLRLLLQKLASMVPASGKHRQRDKLKQLSQLAKAATLRYCPPAGTASGAALGLRLPQLGNGKDLDIETLMAIQACVVQLAERHGASLSERGQGWVLGFRRGDDPADQAITTATLLQTKLALDFAMAIDVEPTPSPDINPVLREISWRQCCDSAYHSAQSGQTLLLSRLALSQESINQNVRIEQSEHDLYRVSGYSDALLERIEDREAKLRPQPDPGQSH